MTVPGRTAKSLPARFCIGLILSCVAAAARPVGSDPAPTRFRLLEAQVPVLWSDTAQMLLGGLPVSYRRFSSGESPTDTAEAFARNAGMFDQVLAFKGMVVLSGTRDGWHWVAEISSEARGTRGLVSAIPLGAGEASGKTGPGAKAVPSWLPTDATLHFDQVLLQSGVRQRLYVLRQPPPQAWPLLRARLAGMGWSPAPGGRGMDQGSVETWSRQRSRLSLALLPEASGSALFIHFQE